jgi:hypothetical protein
VALRWEKRRILIWGTTRPEISKKYREIVCTGGVFEDSQKLVRLYPIPLRYMEDETAFKKYQWIEAHVARAAGDPRPESYRVDPDGIVLGNSIDTDGGTWETRAQWIMKDSNVFASVESLQKAQERDSTSLGLVKPAEVMDVTSTPASPHELAGFMKRYDEAVQQMQLPINPETGKEKKPLRPSEYRFQVRFRCDDVQCKGHIFSIRDWEADALYFKLMRDGDSSQTSARKVVEKLESSFGPHKDLFFFLGNIHNYPKTFTIVGLWYPRKERQQKLPLGGEV